MHLVRLLVFLLIPILSSAKDPELEKRFPELVTGWLKEDQFPVLEPEVVALRARAKAEPAFGAQLQELATVLSQGASHAEKGAVWDILGNYERAWEGYQYASKPPAVWIHKIRVMDRLHPEWNQLPPGEERNSKYYGKQAYGIARLQSLIAYMKNLRANGITNLGGKFESMEYLVVGRYGPPLWLPHLQPEHFNPPTPLVQQLQLDTFSEFCSEAVQFPDSAAWAFSRLGAIADLRDNLFDNESLVKQANKVIEVMEKPTPWGSIPPAYMGTSMFPRVVPVRFISPELYLALHFQKHAPSSQPTHQGIRQRWNLLTCDPSEFPALADQYLGDDPSEGIFEVVQVWKFRGRDVRLLNYLLDLEARPKRSEYDDPNQLYRAWAFYLNEVVATRPAMFQQMVYNQLTTSYLGPPPERSTASKVKKEQFQSLLRYVARYDSLVFPTHSIAQENGIPLRVQYWFRQKEFKKGEPGPVIKKLSRSPLLQKDPDFRMISSGAVDLIDGTFPRRFTLLEKVGMIIAELPKERQQVYLDSLQEKNTFGTRFLLAEIASYGTSKYGPFDQEPVEAFLDQSLPEILAAPDELKAELSVYASRRILGDSPRAMKIREALMEFGSDRLLKEKNQLLESILSAIDSRDGDTDSLARLIGKSPSEALDTLHNAFQARAPDLLLPERKRRSWESSEKLFRHMVGQSKFRCSEKPYQKFYVEAMFDSKFGKWLIPINKEVIAPRVNRTAENNIAQYREKGKWIMANLPTKRHPELIAVLASPEYRNRFWEEFAESSETIESLANLFETPPEKEWAGAMLRLSKAWNEKQWPSPEVYEKYATALEDPELAQAVRSELFRMLLYAGKSLPADAEKNFRLVNAMAEFWRNDVTDFYTCEALLPSYLQYPNSEEWAKAGENLLDGWKQLVTKRLQFQGGEAAFKHTWIPGILLHPAVELNDSDSIAFLEKHHQRSGDRMFTGDQVVHLDRFIRSGHLDWARRVVRENPEKMRVWFSYGDMIETDGGGYSHLPLERNVTYDRELHEKIPPFIESLSSPLERVTVSIYLNAAMPDESDESLPSRHDRMTALAEQFLLLDSVPDESMNAMAHVLRDLAAYYPPAAAKLEPLLLKKFPEHEIDGIVSSKSPIVDSYCDALFRTFGINRNWEKIKTFTTSLAKAQENSKGEGDYWKMWNLSLRGLHVVCARAYQDEPDKVAQPVRDSFGHIAEMAPMSMAEQYFAFWCFQTQSSAEWIEWRKQRSDDQRSQLNLAWSNSMPYDLYKLVRLATYYQDTETKWKLVQSVLGEAEILRRYKAEEREKFMERFLYLLPRDWREENQEALKKLMDQARQL